MPSSTLRSAVALGVGVALALGTVELALRVFGLGDPVLYDNRLAWGYRPRPNQTRRRIGGAGVHVNALGVRGPDVAATRAPDTTRLLFLGDSVTWGGSYVDDAQLFAAIAADRLASRDGRRVEWLDAGVNGWGPENVLGLVRETHGFDSSAWIVTALEDDLRREKTHAGEVPYVEVSPWTAWEELLLRGAYGLLVTYKRPKPPEDLARLADANLARYREIADVGRAAGARVLLVWHPTVDALTSGVDPNRARFLARGSPEDATLDLGPAYRAAGGHVYLDGMHLDVAGHRVAGEAIADALAGLLR
jgi:lysophospholipase L1-like esterase